MHTILYWILFFTLMMSRNCIHHLFHFLGESLSIFHQWFFNQIKWMGYKWNIVCMLIYSPDMCFKALVMFEVLSYDWPLKFFMSILYYFEKSCTVIASSSFLWLSMGVNIMNRSASSPSDIPKSLSTTVSWSLWHISGFESIFIEKDSALLLNIAVFFHKYRKLMG